MLTARTGVFEIFDGSYNLFMLRGIMVVGRGASSGVELLNWDWTGCVVFDRGSCAYWDSSLTSGACICGVVILSDL